MIEFRVFKVDQEATHVSSRVRGDMLKGVRVGTKDGQTGKALHFCSNLKRYEKPQRTSGGRPEAIETGSRKIRLCVLDQFRYFAAQLVQYGRCPFVRDSRYSLHRFHRRLRADLLTITDGRIRRAIKEHDLRNEKVDATAKYGRGNLSRFRKSRQVALD